MWGTPFEKGHIPWNKGEHHTEETIKKIKEMAVLHPSSGMTGKHHTEEAKNRIREKNRLNSLGRKHTEETKRKVSLSRLKRKEELGYLNSPETRQKISSALKGRSFPNKKINYHKWTIEEKMKRRNNSLGSKNPFYGKTHSEEVRKILRKNRSMQIFPMVDSSIELKIQKFLKLLGIEFFTHHYMKEIEHNYRCDIFIPLFNLVLEVDGNFWHKYPIGKDLDHIRTKELIEKGFKVLRLWESEIKEMNIEQFKERLKV